MRSLLPPSRRSRTGSVLPVVALGIVGLCGFGAVAIDVAQAKMVRGELRNASEAAAHAAVNTLDGSAAGVLRAQAYASQVAALHTAGGRAVDLDAVGVLQLGRLSEGVFVPGTDDPALVTAARVVLRDDAVRTWFGSVAFGDEELVAEVSAEILGGGPTTTACTLPPAIPSCALMEAEALPVVGVDMVLGPDQQDNSAWGRLGTSSPNASYIKSAISGCSGASETGDTVTLNSGQVSAGLATLADAISASTTDWDTSKWGTQPSQMPNSGVSSYGNVIEGQILVFDAGSSCTGLKMNQSYPIYGYASVAVYDAVSTGPVASRSIRLRVVRETTQGVGGGRYFGTKVSPAFR